MTRTEPKLVLRGIDPGNHQLELTFSELWDRPGRSLSEDPRSDMQLIELAGLRVLRKRFRYRGWFDSLLRRWRGSHCQREARNFKLLRRLSVPCPEVLVWAEDQTWLRTNRALMVTRVIPDAETLEVRLQEESLDAAQRRRLISRLAEQVAMMHEAGYLDRDLKFRNILVDGALELYHVDSPQGRSYSAPLPLRLSCRDLGTLMKHAPRYFQPRERLRFLATYSRHRRLSRPQQRHLATLVLKRSQTLTLRGQS